jgi:hypothetical protein
VRIFLNPIKMMQGMEGMRLKGRSSLQGAFSPYLMIYVLLSNGTDINIKSPASQILVKQQSDNPAWQNFRSYQLFSIRTKLKTGYIITYNYARFNNHAAGPEIRRAMYAYYAFYSPY